MTLLQLIVRSLRFYWRTGIVVVFGVALATAVLTGSLLVGDSVTGSIREVALTRLGEIDHAIVSTSFFEAQLADRLKQQSADSATVASVLFLRSAVSQPETEVTIPNVNLIGVDEAFWGLYPGTPAPVLDDDQVALSAGLAHDLGVGVGDDVLISLERKASIAADTLFAHHKRSDTMRRDTVRVAAVLPEQGAGAFGLTAQTGTPRNLFMNREALAERIKRPALANALLVRDRAHAQPGSAPALQQALASSATLPDYGLKVTPYDEKGYLDVESAALVLNQPQVDAVLAAAREIGARPALTSIYLANTIKKQGGDQEELWYAMVGGIEQLAPFTFTAGSGAMPGPDEIWLNSWAAQDLNARVGDRVTMRYYVPGWDGVYTTDQAAFTVAGIVDLNGAADDKHLVPEIQGITDARRIDKWDTPFKIERNRPTPRDNDYWDRYRATPKAYINLDAARAIWQKGPQKDKADWVTSIRLAPPAGMDMATLEAKLSAALTAHVKPEDVGLIVRPVRTAALQASAGTTDFGQIFLGMGFFIVAAAAGLAAVMMRLMADRRAAQAGIMLAAGFSEKGVARAIFAEGVVLTLLGVIIGVPLGVCYAGGMIALLTTWWVGAVGTTALWLHITPNSLLIGGVAGLAVGILSVAWGARDLGHGQVLQLLAGWQARGILPAARQRKIAIIIAIASAILVVAMLACAFTGSIPPSEAFYGVGAGVLFAVLAGVYAMLAAPLNAQRRTPTVARLAVRSAAANRGRSMLAVGLLAAAGFIIVATAANVRDFSRLDVTRKDSGTGGFALQAVSTLPVHYNFGTPEGRKDLAISSRDEATFAGVEVMPFLVSPGEDISCLNLAKATYPRVLGVRPAMIGRGGFKVTTLNGQAADTPWTLLDQDPGDGTVPVFGDADSVMWSLHSDLGQTYTMPGGDGKPVTMRIVGLIHGSVFASELLMSERNFRAVFPGISAPRYFLIGTPPGNEGNVAQALRRNLGDLGLEVRGTRELLNSYITVQNTYLSTILALGGLGFLLGTVGLVIVLFRNALERRREFALMLAVGFSRGHLARLLLLENAGLLLTGLACGTIAAGIAVAPQLASVETRIHWGGLILLLVGIGAFGLLCSLLAARAAVRGAVLRALREE